MTKLYCRSCSKHDTPTLEDSRAVLTQGNFPGDEVQVPQEHNLDLKNYIVAPKELLVLRMILKKYQPWDVFHQIPKNGEAHCCQRGGVDIGIWIVALNGRLTRTVSLFAAKLSIVPEFVGLQIPVQIFNVGIAPRSLRGHSWIWHKNYVLLQPYLQNVGGRLPVNSVETTQSWWSTGEARLVRKTLLHQKETYVTRKIFGRP